MQKMKIFYGLVLVLMLFVSACAQQPAAQPAQQQVQPEEEVMEEVVEEEAMEEAAEEEVMEEAMEETQGVTDIRILNGGAFDPTELTINAGDSVTWFNDDEKEAVVIIFKGKSAYMNSNRMQPGEQFEHEFKEEGSYQFWRNIAFSSDAATITVE